MLQMRPVFELSYLSSRGVRCLGASRQGCQRVRGVRDECGSKVTASYKPFPCSVISFSLVILFVCPVSQVESIGSAEAAPHTLATASSRTPWWPYLVIGLT